MNYEVDPAGIEYLINYDRPATLTVRVPVRVGNESRSAYLAVVFDRPDNASAGVHIVEILEGN